MLKCPYCHYDNEDGALFCEQCKSDLAGAVPAAAPSIPVAHAEPIAAEPMMAEVVSAEVVEAVPLEPIPLAGDGQPAFAQAEPIMAEPMMAEPMPAEPVMAEAVMAEPIALHPIETPAPPAAEQAPPPPPAAAPVPPPAASAPAALAPAALPTPPPPTPPAPSAAPPVAEQPAAPAPTPAPAAPPAAAPAPAAAEPAATTLPPGAQPRLVVLRGQKRNVEYPIYEGVNFIGRADEKPVDIDLEDQEPPDRVWCSRQHACISLENDQLSIEDLNSSNGTYVNRGRLYPGQRRPLSVNDVIQIGNVQLKVLA